MRYLRILSAIALGMFFAVPLAFALPPVTATNLVCTRCVHFSDLAYNVVKSVNILNDSILNEDISATAAISPSKILGIAWTAINDGPGSGLNADFLDGFDNLQFLRSDTSGALNGNLDVSGVVTSGWLNVVNPNSEANVEINNTGAGGVDWLIRSTNDASGHGGGKLVFDIGGVAKAVVTPDAKFGVGTASPANNLDVVSGGNTKALIHANDGINDRNPELELRAGNTDAGAHSILKFSKTAGTIFEKLRIQNGSSADILTLVGNGNVGIGTTNPDTKLHVVVPSGINDIAHFRSDNADADVVISAAAANTASVYTKTGQGLSFGTNQGMERIRITVDGNVGVGTANPNKKLTVDGPGSNTAAAELRAPGNVAWGNLLVLRTLGIGNNGASMLFRNRDVKNWQVGGEDSGDGFQIREDGGDGEYGSGFGDVRLHVNEGGNIGIGTTNPGHKLEVNGPGGSTMALNTIDGYGPSLTFGGGTSFKVLASNVSDSMGSNKLVLSNVGSAANLLTVDHTGNFEVNGDVIGSRLCIGSDCRTVWPSGSSSGGNLSGGGDANRLAKWTGGTTLGNSPVYIDSGNVGIDVAVPGKKLDVSGNMRVDNKVFGPDTEALEFRTGVSSGSPEAGRMKFFTNPGILPTDAVERIRIARNGEIGIGIATASPDAPLHIASGVISDQGVLHVNATSGSDSTRGIYAEAGSNGSNSTAVFGIQTNSSPVSAGGTFGVLGRTLRRLGTTGNSSAAVFGDAIGGGDDFLSPPDADNQPDPFNALANGVQGETWSTNGSAAGGRFYANQGSGLADGVYGETASSASGSYGVYASGSMGATGTKSAVVYTESQGPTELYVVESPEIWFEDMGMGRMENGYAVVALDPLFLETVTIDEENPPLIFIQMYNDVTAFVKPGKDLFEVVERDGGVSNAMFSYRIVAKRRYYEDYRLRPVPNTIDKFMRPDLSLDELKALNQKFGFHFEDFNDRDPSFYKR